MSAGWIEAALPSFCREPSKAIWRFDGGAPLQAISAGRHLPGTAPWNVGAVEIAGTLRIAGHTCLG
jgi:hypothetical protein